MNNAIDAEDALSRAMLKAWEKICDCTGEIKNLKAYLTQLTHNLCVDIHRERHRGTRQVESLEAIAFEYEQEIAIQEQTPVLFATQKELENFFCILIDELPSRLRETFILHFKDELSYQEIAEKLSISYDNVRKRISQARKILQQRYDQDFIGVEDGYSTDLDECKSPTSSQSPKRRKSKNTVQTETPSGETLVLSNELETVQIVDKEEPEQAVTVSQLVVVDSQSDGEVEDKSDLNKEYLQKNVVKQIGLFLNKKIALLDIFGFCGIGKNRLSNNFNGRQDTYPTIINMLFYLFYFQVLWQLWADSGDFHNKIPDFFKKSGISISIILWADFPFPRLFLRDKY